jgi:hypothetical protein
MDTLHSDIRAPYLCSPPRKIRRSELNGEDIRMEAFDSGAKVGVRILRDFFMHLVQGAEHNNLRRTAGS